MDAFATKNTKCVLAFAVLSAALGLTNATSARADDLYGTLKKINDSNTITIGHRESSVPFSYYDENKQPIGYAMDLCNKIVDDVKLVLKKPDLKVAYQLVNGQTRIPMIANNTIDMECGSTTNTLTRQQQVDFSAIYFTTGTRVLARKSAKASEIEDFEGKKVAAVGGSTNERALKSLLEAGRLKAVQIAVVKDYAEGLAAVENATVDGFATDDIVLYGLLAKSEKKAELEVVGRLLTYDPYGIAMRRDDSAFRLVVNKALSGLYRSGEIENIYAKWFSPMNVPVSALMKAGFELQALPE